MFLSLAKKRRSIFQFEPKKLSIDLLEQCLEAAIWAPNHGLTEPWRFYVIGPKTQTELAAIYAKLRADKRATNPTNYQTVYDHAIKKFMAIPQILVVGQVLNDNQTIRQEDFAACACAIQNFQLMAWELSLGVQWSSGPILTSDETYKVLDIDPLSEQLIAALYMGYPKATPKSTRTPFENLTRYYN